MEQEGKGTCAVGRGAVQSAESNHKVVVIGIDFGMTYSGYSIVYPDDKPNSVHCNAPGLRTNQRDQVKVPTTLLKTPEGWFFGLEAWDQYKNLLSQVEEDETRNNSDPPDILGDQQDVHLFLNFKMRLKDVTTSDIETLKAKAENSTYEHNLLDLISLCLKTLSESALSEVRSGFLAGHKFHPGDIRWVVTVPAIWNEFSRNFMRTAAWKAGMIHEEDSDDLVLALEPESAALAVAIEERGSSCGGSFIENSSFIMLDCGGGTVDIASLSVAEVEPLVLDEVAPPVGGPWGSIYVEYSFRDFLSRLFGDENFAQLERHCPTELVEIMEEFRIVKERFDPSSNNDTHHDYRICLDSIMHPEVSSELGLPSLMDMVEAYNRSVLEPRLQFDTTNRKFQRRLQRQYVLSLTKEQMLSFFETRSLAPICQCVNRLLLQQQQQASATCAEKINTIVLVGGYGGSRVLQYRLNQEFPDKTIVTLPLLVSGDQHQSTSLVPQAAVVQGAALYGMFPSTSVTYTREGALKSSEEEDDDDDDVLLLISMLLWVEMGLLLALFG